MTTERHAERAANPFEAFIVTETAGGIVLFAATALALAWENSPWGATYEHLWEIHLAHIGLLVNIDVSLHFFVNEVLMTLFFFVVGLEIRRVAHDGARSSLKLAALPVAAAAGGVIAPALVYLAINGGDGSLARGWAVPTATDIAFAVGVLALLGKRVNPSLRALLLALAIADDVAAIVIIAIVFAGGVSLIGLAVAAAGVAGALLLRKLGVTAEILYALPGAVLWIGLLDAGIHPVLAGVALGLLTPMSGRGGGPPPAVRIERLLHPWVAYLVMPLFALANAGIRLDGIDLAEPALRAVAAAIALGLVVGKPIGITAAAALAVRLGWCALPPGVRMSGVAVVGCLGGIGFTMAIFVATLAFPGPDALAAAKLAVLVGSTAAAALGLLLGARLLRRPS